MQVPVFRFAPSPNGELHLGHACSALINQEMARNLGGRMLLRIEDIDRERCTPALEAAMLHDLEWLGFEWDGTPLRQSERFDAYQEILDTLLVEGLAYPSALSRSEIRRHIDRYEQETGKVWPRDPDGTPHYPGDERNLDSAEREEIVASGRPYALRLDTATAALRVTGDHGWVELSDGNGREEHTVHEDPAAWGDVVLARKDTPASYHLCCVADDAFQGVTHVVRGADLFAATSIHRLLQSLLGYPGPVYFHHQLVTDGDGRKLSKSRKDTSLKQLREAGVTPADIRRMVQSCIERAFEGRHEQQQKSRGSEGDQD